MYIKLPAVGVKAMNLYTLKHRYKFAFYVKIQALFLLILTLVGAERQELKASTNFVFYLS